MAKFLAALLCLVLAAIQHAEATTVRVRFTPKAGLSVSMPRDSNYRFDRTGKKLYVCSRDVLNFYWSGETSGMFMFDGGKSDYDKCAINGKLNFLKTIHQQGSFMTKANREGWRYYAYIPENKSQGCKLKLAVYWDKSC